MPDLFSRWLGVSIQQLRRRHNHSRCAVPTLKAMAFPETLLHGMQIAVAGKTLDGCDVRAVSLYSKHRAGLNGLAIYHYGTGAAEGSFAAYVSPCEAKKISQVMNEQEAWLNLVLLRDTIDGNADSSLHGYPLSFEFRLEGECFCRSF